MLVPVPPEFKGDEKESTLLQGLWAALYSAVFAHQLPKDQGEPQSASPGGSVLSVPASQTPGIVLCVLRGHPHQRDGGRVWERIPNAKGFRWGQVGDKLISTVAKSVSIHAPSGFRAEKTLARESVGGETTRIMNVPRSVNSGLLSVTVTDQHSDAAGVTLVWRSLKWSTDRSGSLACEPWARRLCEVRTRPCFLFFQCDSP